MGNMIGFALSGICALGSLVLFIVVLIKLFKKEGVLKGILGIIFGIYTFIWGWFKHKELKLTKIMVIWTAAMVISVIVQFVFASSGILMMVNAIDAGTLSGPPAATVQPPVKRHPIKPRPGTPAKKIETKSQEPALKAPAQPPETADIQKKEKEPRPAENVNYEFEMKRVSSLLSLNPDNADALYNKGLLDEYKGDLKSAEQEYSKAIDIDKKHTNAYFNRGLLFIKAEKYEQAIQDFSQVVRIDPQSVDALCNRGNAYFQSGKPDLALADYDQAIKLNPNDADIYFNRGVVHLAQGEKEKAMADFHKAVSLGQARAEEYLKPPAKEPGVPTPEKK